RYEMVTCRAMAELKLVIEPRPDADPAALPQRVVAAFRERFNLRPIVELVAPGGLPRFELQARRRVERGAEKRAKNATGRPGGFKRRECRMTFLGFQLPTFARSRALGPCRSAPVDLTRALALGARIGTRALALGARIGTRALALGPRIGT